MSSSVSRTPPGATVVSKPPRSRMRLLRPPKDRPVRSRDAPRTYVPRLRECGCAARAVASRRWKSVPVSPASRGRRHPGGPARGCLPRCPRPRGVVLVMSAGLALCEVGRHGSSWGGFRRAELAWRKVVWIPSRWARITQAGPGTFLSVVAISAGPRPAALPTSPPPTSSPE